MKLSEALAITHAKPQSGAAPFSGFLVCGCTPLHLQTFLTAHLQVVLPEHQVTIACGVYGDFMGNLTRLRLATPDAGAIAMEWADLDPRLGLRSLAGWRQTDLDEIVREVRARLAYIQDFLRNLAIPGPVAMSLPSLPLPPIDRVVPGWMASVFELKLQESLVSFAAWIAGNTAVRVVSPSWLDRHSPAAERLDVKGELASGFPYTTAHASGLGAALASMIQPPPLKKGLITDLDNTLWSGILGEVGAANVSWSLEQKSHTHAMYQEFLRSIAESGALVAIASKNEPARVDEAFERADVILTRNLIFPIEAHWRAKSESVTRILRVWNVGAESVVFVDDSALELAEVRAAYPAMDCLLFPKEPQGVYELIEHLRNCFYKAAVGEEDRIRVASLRKSYQRQADQVEAAADPESFLDQSEGVLTFSFEKQPPDPRVLELLNKTNQFNLNGRRLAEAELAHYLASPEAFVLKATYKDKYGPLGKIAILLGRRSGSRLHIGAWAMSCRAFSRRIEYACLEHLFSTFQAAAIDLDYQATLRNQPFQEFLASVLNRPPQEKERLWLPVDDFRRQCPRLFHRIEEEVHG
jgi:FkbH-like protein